MTLLELIAKATTNSEATTPESQYPIIFNPNEILCNLNPKSHNPSDTTLIKPVEGWKISETDSEIVEMGTQFCKKLKRKLKSFQPEEFLGLLNLFLEKNSEKVGISVGADSSDLNYTKVLIEKVGFLITRDAVGLILEACLGLEQWGLLEVMIVQKVVDHTLSSDLIEGLVEKKRSDLICLCVKSFSEIRSSDARSILKYFLSPPKEGFSTMVDVRKEWEREANLAIEKATSKKLSNEKLNLAKQASILLMIAYDGFSSSELCMHYLFASSHLDELTLSNSINNLYGPEMLKLIRYLGKWVRKYEKFPQAGPCLNAVSGLGSRACEWVPSLESVVRCIGVVLDERFSSLVLSTEYHDELRSLDEAVKSLAAEAKVCCLMADVVENLKGESKLKRGKNLSFQPIKANGVYFDKNHPYLSTEPAVHQSKEANVSTRGGPLDIRENT